MPRTSPKKFVTWSAGTVFGTSCAAYDKPVEQMFIEDLKRRQKAK